MIIIYISRTRCDKRHTKKIGRKHVLLEEKTYNLFIVYQLITFIFIKNHEKFIKKN